MRRRFNPINWSTRATNIFFSALVALTLSLGIILTTQSFASELPVALLSIPEASLERSEVISAPPNDRYLPTPDYKIGLYRPHDNLAFLFGHSSTVFTELPRLQLDDLIYFQDLEQKTTSTYKITNISTEKKSDITMAEVLARPTTNTIILMTCAGEPLEDNPKDYDSRLIITAEIYD